MLERYEIKKAKQVDVTVWRDRERLYTLRLYATNPEQMEAQLVESCGDGHMEIGGRGRMDAAVQYRWVLE